MFQIPKLNQILNENQLNILNEFNSKILNENQINILNEIPIIFHILILLVFFYFIIKRKNTLSSSILSDKEILIEKQKGTIVIEPFNEKQLGNCSYDVTLGEWFYTSRNSKGKYLNPWSKKSIEEYWGNPINGITCTGTDQEIEMGLQIGQQYIILNPGELILAHTNEFIGGMKGFTTMMKGRSTMQRCCLSICSDAGMGDTGFINKYTLELSAKSKHPIVLIVGQRIGQIVFFPTGETDMPYYKKQNSYQSSGNLKELICNWKPENMLPIAKLYNPN
jgi:dCTP deaminase